MQKTLLFGTLLVALLSIGCAHQVAQEEGSPEAGLVGLVEGDENSPSLSEGEKIAAGQKVEGEKVSPEAVKVEPVRQVAKHSPKKKARVVETVLLDKEALKVCPPLRAMKAEKGSAQLNRYYFLRQGDTPEKLAELFYGYSSKSKDVLEWNGEASAWKHGQVIYYQSPVASADSSMRSFYFERAIPLHTHTLMRGETLASVAEKRYGSAESKREIAEANGMKENEEVIVGQVLKVYPVDLLHPDKSIFESNTLSLAKNEDNRMHLVPVVGRSGGNPPSSNLPVKKENWTDEKEKSLAATQVFSFMKNHPLVIVCSAVFLVLLWIYVYLLKRKESPYDF